MRMRSSPTSSLGPAGAGTANSSGSGRIVLRIILAAATVIAAGICAVMLSKWRAAEQTHRWNPVTVTIEESSVAGDEGPDSTGPYRLHLRYTYEHAGAIRSGSFVRFGAHASDDDVAPLLRVAHRYRPGDQIPGLVDPADPDHAVLEPGGHRGFLIAAAIAAAVSLLALLGCLATFRPRSTAPDGGPRVHSIARRADGPRARAALGIFFTVFLLFGGTLSWFITLEPMARARAAQQWTEVDCRIIDSKVRTHHGDSTTYSADVLFEYDIAGRTYRSNRADVRSGSSSDRGSYQRIVNQNPSGRRTTCFVNPADLYDSVLDRSPPPLWSPALIALIFPLVGAIGLTAVIVSSRRAAAPRTLSEPAWTSPLETPQTAGAPRDDVDLALPRVDPAARILRPRRSRIGRVIGVLFFACVWNGAMYILFINQLLPQWQSGFSIGAVFFSLFALPFMAVGLLLVYMVGHSALAILNPRFTLELDHAPVRLGDACSVIYRMSGRRMPIGMLTFRLIGRESATYRHGSNTSTDHHEFLNEVIFQSKDATTHADGTLSLRVPAGAVPSFRAQNNKIEWLITVHGDIRRWPDVDQEYPLHVLPAEETR